MTGYALKMKIKDYKLGFSLKGFLVFALVMAPNIILVLWPPQNDILAGNDAQSPLLGIVMTVSQWLLVALLIFLVNKTAGRTDAKAFLVLAAVCLLGYYAMWALYYTGATNGWIFLGLAVFPSLCFCFAALWLKNYIALIPAVIFGVIHTLVTAGNFA